MIDDILGGILGGIVDGIFQMGLRSAWKATTLSPKDFSSEVQTQASCPQCHGTGTVPEDMKGKTVRCSGCGFDFSSNVAEPMVSSQTNLFCFVVNLFVTLGWLSFLFMWTLLFISDAGPNWNPPTYLLVYSWVAMPLVCCLSIAVATLLYKADFRMAAWAFMCMPIVDLILFLISIWWLQVAFRGVFCRH